jgi:beta-galactosidase GanA
MNLNFKKILKYFLLTFLFFLLIFGGFLAYLFIGTPPQAKKIIWGVNFSQKHSENLGLNWRENYLALLDDLKVKYLKIHTHWDLLEPEKGNYNFEDLDWQIKETGKRGVKIILVIGMKSGCWPECHLPAWAKSLTKKEQQKEVLNLLKKNCFKIQERKINLEMASGK